MRNVRDAYATRRYDPDREKVCVPTGRVPMIDVSCKSLSGFCEVRDPPSTAAGYTSLHLHAD